MRLVSHILNHILDQMLNHMLNQILDYMLIDFITTALQLLFLWHELQQTNNCQKAIFNKVKNLLMQ